MFLLRPAPKNEDEMMVLIFEYIDRIFSICRPRKVLYMAIDGVVSTHSLGLSSVLIWSEGGFSKVEQLVA